MSFLNFWALGFAALAPVIVLLYLLKVPRRPVTVSTLMFWQRVLQENRRRALFQRLRNLLSLLLHLLIFALILLALMRPTLDRIIREGASTVVILDTRGRMQAVEPNGESRFARAVAVAQGYARQAGELRQVAILTADAEPRIAAPFSGDEKLLRERLADLRATDAGGDLQPAVALGKALLESRAGVRRIVVLTDRPNASTEDSTIPIEYVSVATPLPNVAITRFAVRPVPASPETAELMLEVANYGPEPVNAEVEIQLDGKRIDLRPFHLAPGEQSVQITSVIPQTGNTQQGSLIARLAADDALVADNTAYATLPLPRKLSVLLISNGSWFLEKVLAADATVSYELLAPDAFRPGFAEQFDVVIFDRFVPPNWNLQTSTGNTLFVGTTPLTTQSEPLAQPIVTSSETAHPVMRHVSLENVTITTAKPMALPAEAGDWRFEQPLKSFEEPLMVTATRNAPKGVQRFAAIGFDVEQSDLPLRVAFPLLISNTLHWLVQAPPAIEYGTVTAGTVVPLAPGEKASIMWDLGTPPPVQTDVLQSHFFEGFAIESPAGTGVVTFTFDTTESDLSSAQASAGSTGRALPAARWLTPLTGAPLWHYLALAALALFTWEWWLFHRRQSE
ncbi:MAG: vWA domain-containing protein [Chthoniobacteraceae bacterium]